MKRRSAEQGVCGDCPLRMVPRGRDDRLRFSFTDGSIMRYRPALLPIVGAALIVAAMAVPLFGVLRPIRGGGPPAANAAHQPAGGSRSLAVREARVRPAAGRDPGWSLRIRMPADLVSRPSTPRGQRRELRLEAVSKQQVSRLMGKGHSCHREHRECSLTSPGYDRIQNPANSSREPVARVRLSECRHRPGGLPTDGFEEIVIP